MTMCLRLWDSQSRILQNFIKLNDKRLADCFVISCLRDLGLPWRLRICMQCGKPGFEPWVGKIPWRRAWQPTPVFLPGEPPWTEEPGRLQAMRLQRVEHDRATKYRLLNTEVQKETHYWDNTFSSYIKLVNTVKQKTIQRQNEMHSFVSRWVGRLKENVVEIWRNTYYNKLFSVRGLQYSWVKVQKCF